MLFNGYMNFESVKKVHCIGIGGIGVSAIARYFLSLGAVVTGTDVADSDLIEQLKKEGINIVIGHSSDYVRDSVDLVVYSPAVPKENPERIQAAKRDIVQMSYPEVLGEISKTRPTIAVTGMHGKSTTTAMLGVLFETAGLDPLVIVGTQVPQFEKENIRLSQSADAPFIVEACEYRGHMNYLSPQMVVITNIEEEHLDFYRDIHHIIETFQEFVDRVPAEGTIVRLERDAILHPLMSAADELQCDPSVLDIAGVSVPVPGEHNRENAALAYCAARMWGVKDDMLKAGLEAYSGIWRRFEVVGSYDDTTVISDYGHHPTEIRSTLQAARDAYPDKKLLLVFQPHQYDRTKKLFDDFIDELQKWDGVVVVDVYDVAGREELKSVGSPNIVAALQDLTRVWFGGSVEDSQSVVERLASDFDVVVVMGAGTVDGVARRMTNKKSP